MDAVTYPEAGVKSELANWVVRREDISTARDLARQLGVGGVPVAIAIAPDGRVKARIEGFVAPKEFAARLAAAREKR